MRVALLAMVDCVSADGAMPRGFLPIGGASVARRQLAAALALECGKVICLAPGMSAQALELQHAAEATKAAFVMVTSRAALVGRITADDEVIVFADGLLCDAELAREALGPGPGVLVLPIETGIAAGFERIDLNHASAGLMRIPGRLVERLLDLPSDCDVASALTRIALQAGVPMRGLPGGSRESGGWLLVRNDEEAHKAEAALIAARIARWPVMTPGLAIARAIVFATGQAILRAGRGPSSVSAGFFALVAAALASGWLGFTASGLACLALAWIVLRVLDLLAGIERDGLSPGTNPMPWLAFFGILFDAVLIILLVWRAPLMPWESLGERAFAPLAFAGMLRLLPLAFHERWMVWLEDRFVACLTLAGFSALGMLAPATMIVTLLLIILAIALGHGVPRLTRT
jgi:hypothetical protein